ncbi:PQQ-binding-like beta-propeller repeat protein [Antarcticirhabdus aurantiaca]|uniref:PQQ-binding-like beta-propeller repeat protein n=1 Tax=Antarcticirhabdus aurantiaca TaxID=2606717 RepID=A0ACD4NIY6_9HYPH|nr:PQQ-binding-like beta-propeller repeat protein [Antarcticirhabdus aurantiaca]WAJ26760.1 PQQ-binding-like beta-propeller repeat protein [Jeongeuplla avenae]
MAPVRHTALTSTVGVILAVLGLVLLAGGGWLAWLGGSLYYLAAGIGFVLTGALLIARRPAALLVYALLVLGTFVWALWEVGLDWWPLAARGGVVVLIGLFLITPPVTRRLGITTVADALDGRTPQPSAFRGAGLALTAVLAVALVGALASLFLDQHRIEGRIETANGPQPDPRGVPAEGWQAYGRTSDGQRYSPLGQITPENVSDLQVAWQYNTGDVSQPNDPEETTFQSVPLKVGNRLFLCTPHQAIVALDAGTGAEVWRTDLQIRGELALQHLTCRGVSYKPPTGLAPPAPSAALDAPAAATQVAQAAVAPQTPGSETSPPATATTGSSESPAEAQRSNEPSTFQETPPLPDSGTLPPTDPRSPVGNLPLAASVQRTVPFCDAMLFMATADGRLVALDPETGSVCANFGGGDGQVDLWNGMPYINPGSYYSTSPAIVLGDRVIVGGTVLDNVSTTEPSGVIRAYSIPSGDLVWNWDSGNPVDTAPLQPGEAYTPNSPNSWSIMSVDEALGLVYVPLGNQPPDQFGGDRSENVERFSSSVVALRISDGTVAWHFQTVHHDLWDYDVPSQPTLFDIERDGQRVPALIQPTKQGELFVLNRETGEPILPVREEPAPQGAVPGDFTAPTQPHSALSFNPPALTETDMWGATLFDQLACRIAFHQHRYEGRFTPPSLEGSIIYPGNFGVFNWGSVAVDPVRQMVFATPTYLAFTSKLIPRPNPDALVVTDGAPEGPLPALNENFGAPYAVEMGPFMSPIGVPCQAPPWGYVAGADLSTGEIRWMHKNGTVRDLTPVPLPIPMGVPGLGGAVLTASGLAFYSGTIDYYVRGYDVTTGAEVWKARLPAGGQSTPMTYEEGGRQFLVVTAGGHGSLGTKRGDAVIAYALPQ